VGIEIDHQIVSKYKATSKKEASKHAARLAIEELGID
jgi:dsRNA-specific ribonuclease